MPGGTVATGVILPVGPEPYQLMRSLNFFMALFFPVLALVGCAGKQQKPVAVRYKNIIILTDPGKRLNLFRQAERDRAIIEKAYAQFEMAARSHFFINSKDRIQVLALPNAQTDETLQPVQEQLYIDMHTVPIKEKAKYIRNRRTAFLNKVDSFYALAAAVPEKTFSNTWKFFNEQLERYLVTDTSFDNYIIVLSDGYSSGIPGAEYTGTAEQMNDARKAANWEAFLAANRLKPVVFPRANLFLFFAEMNASPAFEYFPDELKLVQQSWLGWANFCNSAGVNKTLPRITEGTVSTELTAFLQTNAVNMPPRTIMPLPQNGNADMGKQPVPPKNTEPVYFSGEGTPADKQPVKKNNPEPQKKPVTDKKEPTKKDESGGFTIRQDF